MKKFSKHITLEVNKKGVLDLDITKGCSSGMALDPRGCYGNCYAARMSAARGILFSQHVVRHFKSMRDFRTMMKTIYNSRQAFVRIGTAGDPSEAWEWLVNVVGYIYPTGKPIVVITKHWSRATDKILKRLVEREVYLNTSVSPLDTPQQIKYRVGQFERFLDMGGYSVLRIVTVDPDLNNPVGKKLAAVQEKLLKIKPNIDNPLRAFSTTPAVKAGWIKLRKAKIHSGREVLISLHSPDIYLGTCGKCPDLCGIGLYPTKYIY